MVYRIAKSSIIVMAAAAAIVGTAYAQDRDVQHQPGHSASTHRSDQNSEQRDQRDSVSEQRNTHGEAARNSDERSSENRHRMASADDNDMAARYRREHPHSAARCHDGFFTRTTDRNLACSKHGGIDIWLMQ